MNERIKQLAEQATTEEHDGFRYFDKAKFAELIVRECDQYARSTWEHGEHLGGDLKRLFGIDQ
jgi:hypothetical protein